jgi:hypothetical protein
MRGILASITLFVSLTAVIADGPKDNIADNVRRVPKPGIVLSDADRKELTEGLQKTTDARGVLEERLKPELKQYLPDVEVYDWAVRSALKYNEFFNPKEIAVAKKMLQTGLERADALLAGKHPWTTQTGLVVRGYRSKIDGSVQPYGLVIPKGYDFKTKIRLDFWCHGRGEELSEVNFIQSCQSSPGQFASDKAIVLNLYGRYCCANKLAGEVDCFEALEHAKKNYPIDEDRLVMRGFSMGGAACWHFAVHYPSVWCAAAPGAGFSETPDFLRVFQNEKVEPTWYEKKLWHMYDCTDYALNIFNLPTVAYSGEKDSQKQAADIMAMAMKAEGLDLVHLIGPNTGHGYEKGAKAELIDRIDAIADKGRTRIPEQIKFVTYTLRYNKCFWLTIDALDQHWERAQVEAEFNNTKFTFQTKNVNSMSVIMPLGKSPFDDGREMSIEVNGQDLGKHMIRASKTGYLFSLLKKGNKWSIDDSPKSAAPSFDARRKVHGLQGPIDDAFLSSFLMVRPTGAPLNEKTGAWQKAEMEHAITHWRRQFRGEAPAKDDKDLTEEDIKKSNLILWGDPSSNSVLKKVADKLPIVWKDDKVVVGEQSFDAATHVPLVIYPNPLNPRKYVVLNSGFTFREYDYLNNARQVPKLPDFAIVDVTTPPNARYPGKIVDAGFFDEAWKLRAK